MVAPALIAGAAALGGAAINYFGQKKANKAGIASAREQERFQERMSSTAYQRSLDDARKAGLNPLLMGKYGGASTPGGAMFAPDSETTGAVSSALEARRMYAEIENLENQNANLSNQAKKLEVDSKLVGAQTAGQLLSNATQAARLPKEKLYSMGYQEAIQFVEDLFNEKGTPGGSVKHKPSKPKKPHVPAVVTDGYRNSVFP